MTIKWALIYKTKDPSASQLIKAKLEQRLETIQNDEIIPGVHIFVESTKTLAMIFRFLRDLSSSSKLQGQITVLRLLRLTDDSNMLPILQENS